MRYTVHREVLIIFKPIQCRYHTYTEQDYKKMDIRAMHGIIFHVIGFAGLTYQEDV